VAGDSLPHSVSLHWWPVHNSVWYHVHVSKFLMTQSPAQIHALFTGKVLQSLHCVHSLHPNSRQQQFAPQVQVASCRPSNSCCTSPAHHHDCSAFVCAQARHIYHLLMHAQLAVHDSSCESGCFVRLKTASNDRSITWVLAEWYHPLHL